jgi:hypothetical protein
VEDLTMQVADAKLILKSDVSVWCMIRIVKDDSGNQTWSRWGNTATMALTDNSGTWAYRPSPNDDVLFKTSDGTSWAVLMYHGLPDFFGFFCSQPLTGVGNINDDNMSDITWSIWTGCI